MFDHAISGYRHKVTFFKTPGDLWMLKGTSPNVCLTIAPNYRLQNEIHPTIESSGNVISRRFVGPLLRRYCATTTKTHVGANNNKAKARNLICEGRAISCTPSGDVMRKADDTTSRADDVRQADDGRKTAAAVVRYDDIITKRGDSYYRRQDDTQQLQCFSSGMSGGVRCGGCGGGLEGWPDTRGPRLPWHVGRVYSGDSLTLVPHRSRLSPAVKDRTQSSLTVSQLQTKQVIATTTTRARSTVVQQPMKSHVVEKNNLPILYGNVNSRAFAIGEKKHIGQVEHEPKLISSFTKEETGSNAELRLHECRLDNIQNSLVVCKLHPLKTRSGPTVTTKSTDLNIDILDRAANNTPEEDGAYTSTAADHACEATRGDAEQTTSEIQDSSGQSNVSQETCRKVTVQSISEPNATIL